MWTDMINAGWNAMVEDASEFNVSLTFCRISMTLILLMLEFCVLSSFVLQERVESGVVMEATMSDTTETTYMVRIDSTDFSG